MGAIFALTACSLAPPQRLPLMPIPQQFKEGGQWVLAKPNLVATQNTSWWTLFNDACLNTLEEKLSCDNHHLKQMWGRYAEALAIAQSVRSAMYPTLTGIGNIARQGNSKTLANSEFSPELTFNTFLLAAVLNYEIDAWGRVRNAVIASESLARASQFDLAAIDLSLHAELAGAYFQLRGDDEAIRVLDRTVRAYEKALYLTEQRHRGGVSPEADVDQAKTQLENAKTLATDRRLKRAQLEHAIAVLTGEIPSNFTLHPTQKPFKPVIVNPDLPSTLLLRRPDIAAAIQRMQAANADIGVARAAFLPQLNLVSMIGFQSSQFSQWFNRPSLIWSIGPSLALTLVQPEAKQILFDGFKLQALLMRAKARYFETLQIYQQTVLTAFQQVEDQLVAIRRLKEAMITQTASTKAAKRALYQANQRYKGGLVTYLDVVITENEALQAELALITIRTRLQLASIQLIKSLGGGWCPLQ